MRYCTCSLIGLIPRQTSLSKRLWFKPALAAFLHIITGPSWQWSPTKMTCFAPFKIEIRVSGSFAWVASSIKTWVKRNYLSLLSKAATQVVQITSAFLRISSSAYLFKSLSYLSSFSERSPYSSFLVIKSCMVLKGPWVKCLICSCKDR